MKDIYHDFYVKDATWCDAVKRVEVMREKIESIKETLWTMGHEMDDTEFRHLTRVRWGCEMALENMEARVERIEASIRNRVKSTHNVPAMVKVAVFYAEDDSWMEREFDRKGYLRGFKF